MEKIKAEDLLNYRMLSDVQYAPDCRKFAFLVKQANKDGDGYDSSLWLSENGKVRLLTDDSPVSRFFWEGDGYILFAAVRDETDQEAVKHKIHGTSFYRLDIKNGTIRKAFRIPLNVTGIRKLDEVHVIFMAKADALNPDGWKGSEEEQKAATLKREQSGDVHVIDETPFWLNGQGITNKTRDGLFLYTLSTGELRRVTDAGMSVRACTVWKNDIIYIGCSYETKWSPYQSIYHYETKTGKTRVIYDGGGYRFRNLECLGEKLIVKALERDSEYGLGSAGYFYEIRPDTGEILPFCGNDAVVGASVGSDCRLGGGTVMKQYGDRLYFIATIRNSGVLCSLSPEGSFEIVFDKEGSMDSFDIDTQNGILTAVCLYDGRPQELYQLSLSTGELRKLTDFNGKALENRYVAEVRGFTFRSGDRDIDGFVLLPKDFDENKTYPAILDIHGGPVTAYGKVFFHEMQYWAGEGYFVFFCNPTGSDGRGIEFSHIYGRMGGEDYKNLCDFTDEVLRRFPQIDADRIGVTGGSYGGFMTNWIIGHTDRFACAVSQRSISNWLSFYGLSDIGSWSAWEHAGADMYENFDRVWNASPLRYADRVRTPVLFLHADEDYRCPLSEGMQMMTAVAAQGVPTRMVIFHGENHELSRSGKPKHRLRRLKEITDWMDRYLKPETEEGQEASCAERRKG